MLDLALTLDDHGQRGRFYTTATQLGVILSRIETGKIDAAEPVCLLPRQGGCVKRVVVAGRLRIAQRCADGRFLQR